VWLRWLNRRNRGRAMDWKRFSALLQTLPLAPPRIVHSLWQSNPQLEEPYA
jgi:heme oxygenase